jgi:hypothetical protein
MGVSFRGACAEGNGGCGSLTDNNRNPSDKTQPTEIYRTLRYSTTTSHIPVTKMYTDSKNALLAIVSCEHRQGYYEIPTVTLSDTHTQVFCKTDDSLQRLCDWLQVSVWIPKRSSGILYQTAFTTTSNYYRYCRKPGLFPFIH